MVDSKDNGEKKNKKEVENEKEKNEVVTSEKVEEKVASEEEKQKSNKEKKNVMNKNNSLIILSLGDEVLKEFVGETTLGGVWLKLEGLYMTKSLTNKLYLKKRLHQLKIEEGTSIRKHVDGEVACMELRTEGEEG